MARTFFSFTYRRRLALKRTVLLLVALLLAIVGASAYVGLRARSELAAAQAGLQSSPSRLSEGRLAAAKEHIDEAVRTLTSFPADVLRYVPVVGDNVDALREVADATSPALSTSFELRTSLEDALSGGMIRNQTVDLGAMHRLEQPLRSQVKSLDSLHGAISTHLGGMLLPPLYGRLQDLGRKIASYDEAATHALDLLRQLPAIGGEQGRRTYLVALLNNSELRGAGGILSGIGTVKLDHGKLSIGRFQHYRDLTPTNRGFEVPAPKDFTRRFARFNATSTLVNTSAAPQVPQVALVAARLYRKATGAGSDGVIFADPRGLQALLPPGNVLRAPRGQEVATAGLARYIYSGVYEATQGLTQSQRRTSLIDLGGAAFDHASGHALGSLSAVERVGAAVAGGHLRFVSFHRSEERALDAAGASGRLPQTSSDSVLVTVENFGGDKLDYWAERRVTHLCDISGDGAATCETSVRLHNAAPDDLPVYVRGGRPEAELMSELDIYVPGDARVRSVRSGDSTVRFFTERDYGRIAIGTNLRVPPKETQRVEVVYRLPPNSHGYSLDVSPQPLAHDASLVVSLRMPARWELQEGQDVPVDSLGGGSVRYQGLLSAPISVRVGPRSAPGITGLWQKLVDFWQNPLTLGAAGPGPEAGS